MMLPGRTDPGPVAEGGPGVYDATMAETISITGHGGEPIEAYLARPLGPGPYGGVVLIHHMPGYDRESKEATRRFAAEGYLCLCPNLHHHDAPGASPDDAAAASRAAGMVPDARMLGDVAGAAAHLRSLTSSNGKVGAIGYCSGGRQAFIAACRLDLDAAVDCYGGFGMDHGPEGENGRLWGLGPLAPDLNCPLLGLFGNDDGRPSPEDVAALEKILSDRGKSYEFHSYDGAGHAFFSVDRPAYRPEAAVDGWRRILAFYGRHLAA
jgi:carboxymethylenebutenolidase